MELSYKNIKLILSLGVFFLIWQNAASQISLPPPPAPKAQDTIKKDTLPPLKYFFRSHQKGSLYLKDPSKSTVIYDSESGHYLFLEKIGD